MKRLSRIVLGSLLLAAGCRQSTPTESSTPAYLVHPNTTVVRRDIGTLGGTNGYAIAINDNSQVAGHSDVPGGGHRAFIWKSGRYTTLGLLPGGSIGVGNGINLQGDVVGYVSIGIVQHATRWSGGAILDLGSLFGGSTSATAINQAGQIVGTSADRFNDSHAFLWENGTMAELPTLGGDDAVASAINISGVVAGMSDDPIDRPHAVTWHNRVPTDLGTLGGTRAFASGINDQGDVVGGSTLANSGVNTHAFLWHNGVMTDLGLLPGGVSSQALAINNQGQVVGFATTATGPNHGFAWSNGVMTDLGTLGGSFSQANAINSLGRIAGFSHTAAIVNHGVVWQVVP